MSKQWWLVEHEDEHGETYRSLVAVTPTTSDPMAGRGLGQYIHVNSNDMVSASIRLIEEEDLVEIAMNHQIIREKP